MGWQVGLEWDVGLLVGSGWVRVRARTRCTELTGNGRKSPHLIEQVFGGFGKTGGDRTSTLQYPLL